MVNGKTTYQLLLYGFATLLHIKAKNGVKLYPYWGVQYRYIILLTFKMYDFPHQFICNVFVLWFAQCRHIIVSKPHSSLEARAQLRGFRFHTGKY